MTKSQLGNLNDGQAVRKAVFEMVFRLPERQGVIKKQRKKVGDFDLNGGKGEGGGELISTLVFFYG